MNSANLSKCWHLILKYSIYPHKSTQKNEHVFSSFRTFFFLTRVHRTEGCVWAVCRIPGGKCSRFKQGSASLGGGNRRVSLGIFRRVKRGWSMGISSQGPRGHVEVSTGFWHGVLKCVSLLAACILNVWGIKRKQLAPVSAANHYKPGCMGSM